jgi:predicted Zn-dependent peptidase
VQFDAWKRQLYNVHDTRNTVIGTKEDIRGIRIEDVLSMHRTFYRPSNMTLIGVGDVDHDTVVATARDAYAALGKGQYVAPPTIPSQPEPEHVLSASNFGAPMRRDDVTRPKTLVGWKQALRPDQMSIDERIDEHLIREFAGFLLCGEGTLSRELLIRAGLDERTLSCDVIPFRDHGEIAIGTETETPEQDCQAILEAARRIMRPEPGEFEYARSSMLLGASIKRNDLLAHSEELARITVLTGDPASYDRKIERIKTITQEEVAARLPDIFAPHKFAATLMVPTDGK